MNRSDSENMSPAALVGVSWIAGLAESDVLGGVGFLTTLGVGIGFLVRLRLWWSNWIVCYITRNSRNSFETFV